MTRRLLLLGALLVPIAAVVMFAFSLCRGVDSTYRRAFDDFQEWRQFLESPIEEIVLAPPKWGWEHDGSDDDLREHVIRDSAVIKEMVHGMRTAQFYIVQSRSLDQAGLATVGRLIFASKESRRTVWIYPDIDAYSIYHGYSCYSTFSSHSLTEALRRVWKQAGLDPSRLNWDRLAHGFLYQDNDH